MLWRVKKQQAPAPDTTANVQLLGNEPVHRTDERYLSWSIDISVFAGGFWWEGSLDSKRGLGTLPIPPLDLNSGKLNRLVRALGPAYLRIGGSEADKLNYFNAPPEEPDALVLTREQWDDLHEFIRRHDLKLIFTCKYGLFKTRHHGHWRGDEVEELLRYSRERDYRIDVFELGNELNAYWAFHGLRSQPGPKNLARDYATFIELVKRYYPQARISGPGSAFWPRLGETIKPFTNLTPRFLRELSEQLDIVDWHYYPYQSERSPVRTRAARLRHMLNPATFEDFKRYSEHLARLRDAHQPQAELWTGETGSAQCGGQPFLSDRWASSFWWLDQLGQGARLGQKVMVRQALIGGDYGLLDRLTRKPRADFWSSWLWRQLMGTSVYAVDSDRPWLRAYLHNHPSGDGMTLLLINLSEEEAAAHLQGLQATGEHYTLTGKRPTSRKVRINGAKPKLRKKRIRLKDLPPGEAPGVLPPLSISFWRVEATGVTATGKKT